MKPFYIKVWAAIFTLLLPQTVGAWGHTTDLNEEWSKSQLVFPIIQKRQIKYCMDIQSSRFDEASLRMQIEFALKLWLNALEPIKLGKISVSEVDCGDATFNLKVQVGEEKAYPNLGSYQVPEWRGEHYYSLVKIDSNYANTIVDTEDKSNRTYRNEDFMKFAGGKLLSQKNLIHSVSFARKKTLRDFCVQEGLDCQAVFLSSYISLIHEIGHSFGLCDTEGDLVECDDKFTTKQQPSSVMKDDTYFFLTKDDVEGIQSLFKRYKAK